LVGEPLAIKYGNPKNHGIIQIYDLQTPWPPILLAVFISKKKECAMNPQPLKNKRGCTIGWITTERDGTLWLKTVSGVTKGIYDPKLNQTKTFAGKVLGKGNLLDTLLS
jgi:hypothetical protein